MDRKKEVRKTRKKLPIDSFKILRIQFTESESGRLECHKQELKDHLSGTYSDQKRDRELPPFPGLKRPTNLD